MERRGVLVAVGLGVLLLVITVLAAGIPTPLARSTKSAPACSITAPGQAELPANPEMLAVSIEVRGEADNVSSAHLELRANMEAVSNLLKQVGIKEPPAVQAHTIIPFSGGAAVMTVIEVKIDIDSRRVIDEISSLSGVSLCSIRPAAGEVASLRAEAIRGAVQDARQNALEAASASGLKILGVRSVEILEIRYPVYPAYRPDTDLTEDTSSHMLKVHVSVTFDAK